MSNSVDEVEDVIEYSDLVRNTDATFVGGVQKPAIRYNYGLLSPWLTKMQRMVADIETQVTVRGAELKRNRLRTQQWVLTSFGRRYFSALTTFLALCPDSKTNVFSPHVTAIFDACALLKIDRLFFQFGDPNAVNAHFRKRYGEIFNDLIVAIGQIVRTPEFRSRVRVRNRNSQRNEAKALDIERQVFESKARHLVLILHFGYREDYRSQISVAEIQSHRTRFFNNFRTNKLLSGIVDYIWKLEEGEETGVHLHTVLFYSGDSCHDVYIAQQIGKYWEGLTQGKGQYWNSNADKEFYSRRGLGIATGTINYNDEEKRAALRQVLRYMTKADQFLRIKHSAHSRVFGTSRVSKKKKLGRPRTTAAE